jgi:hypothetical protein
MGRRESACCPMNDFLDDEAGDFDWGPDRRARSSLAGAGLAQPLRARRPRLHNHDRLLLFVAMVAVGSVTLAVAGVLAWQSFNQSPRAAAVPAPIAASTATPAVSSTPTPTPQPTATPIPTIVVHVSGEVREPGIVEVSIFARVFEALEAAGGAAADANLDRINLAAPLVDGAQLHVPARDEPAQTPGPGTTS